MRETSWGLKSQSLLAPGDGQRGMKNNIRAHLLNAATPQGIPVSRGPHSTSRIQLVLSQPVPPPPGAGSVGLGNHFRLALEISLRHKACPTPTETTGNGTETDNLPPDSLYTMAKQGPKSNCC